MNIKSEKARGFLAEGYKVAIQLQFRGRERSHPEMGVKTIEAFAKMLEDSGKVEQSPRQEGRKMNALVAPLQGVGKKSPELIAKEKAKEKALAEAEAAKNGADAKDAAETPVEPDAVGEDAVRQTPSARSLPKINARFIAHMFHGAYSDISECAFFDPTNRGRWLMKRLPLFPIALLALLGCVALTHALSGVALPTTIASPVVAVATMVIFFVTGLALPWRSVLAVAHWWRLVVPLLLLCYGLWPLAFFMVVWLGQFFAFGFFDLGVQDALGWAVLVVLPTTITSCVAMTALAYGNVAGAVQVAVVLNIVSLLIVPVWLQVLIADTMTVATPWQVLPALLWRVVLPLLLGWIVAALWGAWQSGYTNEPVP